MELIKRVERLEKKVARMEGNEHVSLSKARPIITREIAKLKKKGFSSVDVITLNARTGLPPQTVCTVLEELERKGVIRPDG